MEPTTEASGDPLISRTAHSTSNPWIAFSTSALESNVCASSIAAANSFADLTFVLPKAFSGSPDRLHGVSMTL